MTQKKLSRREREEQRQMRRLMIFGGAAVGIAAAVGIGVTLLPASFPHLDGTDSLANRLAGADLLDGVVNLTPAISEPSLMVIGTTDCVHCRAFVKDGLEDAVRFAKSENLGFIYAPMGNSPLSLASSRLIGALARAGVSDPAALRMVYDHSTELGDAAGFARVADKLGATFGLSSAQIAAAKAETGLETTGRIQALARAFPIQGTPMFFVASGTTPGRINWFSGWANRDGFRRQVSAARGV